MADALTRHYDVAVVGSGAGGGTLAWALARRGRKVLLIEQGDHLPAEPDNATDAGVFGNKYFTREPMDICGRRHDFPVHAYVGGQTKLYGAALYRFREADFGELHFPDGVSPAWPLGYDELEPWYCEAEKLYRVHGAADEDPTEPPRSCDFPFPAVEHEPFVARLVARLRRQGLHVSAIPKAIDLQTDGNCRLCTTCDAYACPTHGKLDTEVACIRPALATGNLTLLTGATCRRLLTSEDGRRVTGMELDHEGQTRSVDADIHVAACGVVHSPALLLRSACAAHPHGLANSSGLVGRNLCGHNASFFFLPGLKPVPALHQKTFAVHDFYLGEAGFPYPMGILQAAGRMPVWQHVDGWQRPVAEFLGRRSLMCFIMSEIWPDPDNRISLAADGAVRVDFRPNNVKGFRRLRARFMSVFRRAGYPAVVSSRHPGVGIPWHPVGTLRFGNDPASSVLNTWCQTHDVDNLYVVDSCFMPSAGAVNTSLTVMAQSLRVADHIHRRLQAG